MFNSVEYVRDICSKRNIPVSQLEKDCGFANGYMNPKKLKKIPYDRAKMIADYLGLSLEYLLTGTDEKKNISAPIENGRHSTDPDIYRIERAKKRMSKAEWKKQMRIIEASFGDYFSDEYKDDDVNE